MEAKQLQTVLNQLGAKPTLEVDGLVGKKTLRAVDERLIAEGRRLDAWSDERKIVAIEQLMLRASGIEVGAIDGLVGPQTLYARDVFAARKRGDSGEETWRDVDVGPESRETVWPKQRDVKSFYGEVGTRQASVILPFPMRIAWDLGLSISRFSAHEKVKEPLERIFGKVLDHYGRDEIVRLRLDRFGGCLNVRKMRGGSSYSMHAWGIAVDIDPERNQLKWKRNLASLDDPPYEAFWQIVESEGAVSLGRERDFDWMHFQFARL